MANFRENKWEWKGKPFECKPGQFITSAKSIQNNCGCGVTRQNIRTALQRLSKLEFLTIETTNTGMLITILNWERYQGDDYEANQRPNQQPTSNQPTPNQRLTTKEEGKEGKEGKKVKNNIFIPPTLEEIQAYCKERNNKVDAKKFFDYFNTPDANGNTWIDSKGNKVKNWKQKIITWEKNNFDKPQSDKPIRRNNFQQRDYDNDFYSKLESL